MNKATEFQYKAIQIMQKAVQELSDVATQLEDMRKGIAVQADSVKCDSPDKEPEVIDYYAFGLFSEHNDNRMLEHKIKMYVKLHNDFMEYFENFSHDVKYMFDII